ANVTTQVDVHAVQQCWRSDSQHYRLRLTDTPPSNSKTSFTCTFIRSLRLLSIAQINMLDDAWPTLNDVKACADACPFLQKGLAAPYPAERDRERETENKNERGSEGEVQPSVRERLDGFLQQIEKMSL